MAPRRKGPGKRWSATSTVEWRDRTGATLTRTRTADTAPAGAAKARVHYRLDGRSKKATVTGPDLAGRVAALQALLAAAYAADWPADERGRPVPPAPPPAAVPPAR